MLSLDLTPLYWHVPVTPRQICIIATQSTIVNANRILLPDQYLQLENPAHFLMVGQRVNHLLQILLDFIWMCMWHVIMWHMLYCMCSTCLVLSCMVLPGWSHMWQVMRWQSYCTCYSCFIILALFSLAGHTWCLLIPSTSQQSLSLLHVCSRFRLGPDLPFSFHSWISTSSSLTVFAPKFSVVDEFHFIIVLHRNLFCLLDNNLINHRCDTFHNRIRAMPLLRIC